MKRARPLKIEGTDRVAPSVKTPCLDTDVALQRRFAHLVKP